VRILVDSHVAVWWLDDNPSLGASCRELLSRADEVFFSVVTPWELGIKRALGRLDMPDGLAAALQSGGFTPLAISMAHAERAPALPAHHRDPFDRMLVAQAQLEALSVATADPGLSAYDVELIDARR
jgi:PIN domain nuclease of toxin-antitoxin system